MRFMSGCCFSDRKKDDWDSKLYNLIKYEMEGKLDEEGVSFQKQQNSSITLQCSNTQAG